MAILIVGAGALGQVFGAYLARGGAKVSYLVKPGREPAARTGFVIRQLRRFAAPRTFSVMPERVYGRLEEAAGDWGAIWLCIPSTALQGPWLAALYAHAHAASIVSIGMGIDDRAVLERHWPADQIVDVLPAVIAFSPPAGGADTVFWLPPGVVSVSGVAGRALPVAEALNAGGLASRYGGRVGAAPMVSAANMPMIAAEEVAGWSQRALAAQIPLALRATAEAVLVTAARLGAPAPKRPAPSRFSVWMSGRLFALAAPFDTAVFRRRHFTKVGEQTLQMLDGWIAEGWVQGRATPALTELRAALAAVRAP